MNYFEEKKAIIDGIPYQYLCHVEKTNKCGSAYPAHYHNYIEILFGLSGVHEVFLGSSYHEFTVNDMVLINSKEVHQINSLSDDGGEYVVVRFDPEIIYNSMSQNHFELKYLLPFTLENTTHRKVIKASEIDMPFIPNLFNDIINEFTNRNYGYELAIKNHIGMLFLWILRYLNKTGSNLDFNSNLDKELIAQIQPAFTYVAENFDKDIKVIDMAKLCNMSYSYFSRVFNKLMNMNFSTYLSYIRISEAEKLLVSTNIPITEIATAVGFNTSSYFIKHFQNIKHISPKQFRNEFKK